MTPRPPAEDTAAASGAVEVCAIPLSRLALSGYTLYVLGLAS